MYTAYGDGIGFGGPDNASDIGVAKISGVPGQLAGTQLAGATTSAGSGRHPTATPASRRAWHASAARCTSPCRTWPRVSKDAAGSPTWSTDIDQRKPVLHDDRRVYPNVYAEGRSKYISADGRLMWLQSNVCLCGGRYPEGDHWAYTFSLRRPGSSRSRLRLPGNGPDDGRNLAEEPGTVPVERAGQFGMPGSYSDGNKQQLEAHYGIGS